jgi:acylphosphatase
MSARQIRRVFVEGDVQGVGYREFVRRSAIRLGVTGWVRNRHNGSVEAFMQGARGDLEALIIEMRNGPQVSEVARLLMEEDVAADAEISSVFIIRPTV